MAAPPLVQRKRKGFDAAEEVDAAPPSKRVAVQSLNSANLSFENDTVFEEQANEPQTKPKLKSLLSDIRGKKIAPGAKKIRNRRPMAPPNEEVVEDDVEVGEPVDVPSSLPTAPETASLAPQFTLVDGKLVLRPESVVVEAESSSNNQSHLTVVEESGQGRHITSASFMKRVASSAWNSEEIDTFYKALRKCGTDFGMMSVFLPGRDRNQIRRRYKREEKEHPERIDYALSHRINLTAEEIQQLKGVAPTVDEESLPNSEIS